MPENLPAPAPAPETAPALRPLPALLRRFWAWLQGLHAEPEAMTDAPAPAPAAPENSSLDSVTSVSNSKVSPPQGEQSARAIGPRGIALIKQFEGCERARADGRIEAYPDPGTGAHPWTIGWGATGPDRVHGGRIGPGTIWTQSQCDARLSQDLVRYAGDVARALGTAPTTQGQFDALVSFHYNTGAIARATLTKKHIAGDFAGAAREFARWNRAGGRVMRGLARRRAAEAEIYLS